MIWDGQARTVESDAADSEPLVGMSLIYGYDLRIQAVDGGTVTLEALPYAGAKVATKPGLTTQWSRPPPASARTSLPLPAAAYRER